MPKRALLALLAVLAAAAISWGGLFYFRDNFSTHYALKSVSAASYRHGQIPFWNELAGGGQPLAGNPNALTFYPDNILYLLLPFHVAFNLHFLLHLFLAFAAMRALCRETGSSDPAASLAAFLYAASGLSISATVFYNLVTAVALVPLAFCATERLVRRPSWRAGLALGAACGLLGLAGEPVTVAGAALGIAIIAFARMRQATHRAKPDPASPADETPAAAPLRLALAGCVAILAAAAIAAPQLIAFSEIAHEVERSAHPFSSRSVLAASLPPWRIAELVAGPLRGLVTDLGPHAFHPAAGGYPPLFPSLFMGGAVIPALFRRGALRRYQLLAASMLFLALGASNPVVRLAVDSVGSLRFGRYPEKLALPLVVALFVLIGEWLTMRRRDGGWLLLALALPLPLVGFDLVRRSSDGALDAVAALAAAAILCSLLTAALPGLPDIRIAILMLFPIVYWAVRVAPVDRYAPYRDALAAAGALSGHSVVVPDGRVTLPAAISTRDEYRLRARLVQPLFGAAAGIRYTLDRSPEGMYSFLSRIAWERFSAAPAWLAERYAALAGSEAILGQRNTSGATEATVYAIRGPVTDARFVASALPARSIQEAVRIIETPSFRPGVDAVIPAPARLLASGRVISLVRSGGRIEVAVVCDGEALLRLPESYWSAWGAAAIPSRNDSTPVALRTLPVDLDRLGVIVPAGTWRVTLTFGRHRQLVAVAWLLSAALLVLAAVAGWRSRKASAAPAR
jgi:hypothetical protein